MEYAIDGLTNVNCLTCLKALRIACWDIKKKTILKKFSVLVNKDSSVDVHKF